MERPRRAVEAARVRPRLPARFKLAAGLIRKNSFQGLLVWLTRQRNELESAEVACDAASGVRDP